MKPLLLIAISVFLGAAGQLSIKWGTIAHDGKATSAGAMLMNYMTSLPILFGLLCYGCSSIVWIFAVARVELSYAYPMVALGYVIVVGCAFLFFNETVGTWKIIGLLTIIAGVIMVSRQ
ncbi:EamA family transporter [Cohnella sp. GCM10027633]|uniref:EamA family transporter n=1 Tax=unclassified Cohnella TaxID=2636738 RepID=UPI0036416EED